MAYVLSNAVWSEGEIDPSCSLSRAGHSAWSHIDRTRVYVWRDVYLRRKYTQNRSVVWTEYAEPVKSLDTLSHCVEWKNCVQTFNCLYVDTWLVIGGPRQVLSTAPSARLHTVFQYPGTGQTFSITVNRKLRKLRKADFIIIFLGWSPETNCTHVIVRYPLHVLYTWDLDFPRLRDKQWNKWKILTSDVLCVQKTQKPFPLNTLFY